MTARWRLTCRERARLRGSWGDWSYRRCNLDLDDAPVQWRQHFAEKGSNEMLGGSGRKVKRKTGRANIPIPSSRKRRREGTDEGSCLITQAWCSDMLTPVWGDDQDSCTKEEHKLTKGFFFFLFRSFHTNIHLTAVWDYRNARRWASNTMTCFCLRTGKSTRRARRNELD